MPLSATRNYTPIGVMIVVVVIIVLPQIIAYDNSPPTIVVVVWIVDMLFCRRIYYSYCYDKYILNNFNMQDFQPLFAQKVLISKANTYTTHHIRIVSHWLKAYYSTYIITPLQNPTKKDSFPQWERALISYILYIRYIINPRRPTRYLLQQPSR